MERLLTDEYRILSFDPGSRSLGMCLQVMDLQTLNTQVIYSETLKVDRIIQDDAFINRLDVIKHYVEQCCRRWSPTVIVVELPYMGRMPQAFGALREVVHVIRQGCINWLPHCVMFFYEPSVVKKAVDVPGTSGDKGLMKKALLAHPCISISSSVDVESMDEHAIDAALIGYAHVHLGIKKKDKDHGKKKQKTRKKGRSEKAT